MSNFEILGLMSGTSLDGLDIAHVRFQKTEGKWSFEIVNADSEGYSKSLKHDLKTAPEMAKEELKSLDVSFAVEMGERVNRFIEKFNIDKNSIQAIASHGHTVLHQPHNGFSLQIGCGETLAKSTGINVINDFRNKDIGVGGQGAPLVPIGDKLLFSNKADAFLNLGGFCNITFKNTLGEWKAFDISPCNLPLNKLSEKLGQNYDDGGRIAKSGNLILEMLNQMNALQYYQDSYPKSLGTEWLESQFMPIIDINSSIEDNLNTVVEHLAIQIAEVIQTNNLEKVFVTGGGAFNTYLLSRIEALVEKELIIPTKEIIEYKEALIFAFLGALYLKGEPSNVPSATGARKEITLGVFYEA